ncbi:MAG TPA: amidase [Herpetosiphonaceae bacterium]|nr:amidase [Herpetosiphonaceae bacterium]
MELTNLDLSAAAGLIKQRAISPVELTQAHLERIERIDPLINSFITVTAEPALDQARAAEEAIAYGGYRGPLHGIPIALKDLFETAGVRTTAGSAFLRDHIPDRDSAAVERLNAAGAVSLGKLNMHEWAMSVTNLNPHYGDCRNPWDTERIPGGSSGGSGAALAAGLCLGALGSDTAGSIRIPAALCGVVGLKPTYGRCSSRGALPLSWTMDHVGPMARSVRDAAILLQAIAGYDPADPYSADQPADDYAADLEGGVSGWRVALALDGFVAPEKTPDPAVVAAVRAAAAVFADLGANVEEVAPPPLRDLWRQNSCLLMSDALAFHQERLREAPELFGADVLAALERAGRHTGLATAQAGRARAVFRQQLGEFFGRYDLLLTISTPVAATLRAEGEAQKADRPSLISYTAPFNFVSLPALSLPCGFTEAGLPIGLQIVARPWAEAALLRAGHAYEQSTQWHTRRPAL